MPLHWRKSIAKNLRSNSSAQYQSYAGNAPEERARKTNVTLRACAALQRDLSGNKLIHGHTHLPAHHHEQLHEQTWQRWVLSDWDLEPIPAPSTLPRDSAEMAHPLTLTYTLCEPLTSSSLGRY